MLLFGGGTCVFSQNGESDMLLHRFEERFRLLDSLIFARQASWEDSSVWSVEANDSLMVAQDTVLTPYDSALMELTHRRIKEFKGKTGLQLTGQYYHRFDHTVGFDEEDDPRAGYDDKIQVELRWYFLQSALFRRKGHIEEIRIKEEIERTANKKESFGISIYRQKENFRFLHDSLLSGILQHRVKNLELLSDANQYLLFSENMSSDELLKVLDEKAAAERLLSSLPEGFPVAGDFSCVETVSVHIDTTALINHIEESQEEMRMLSLRIKLLEQQESNTSYWDNCRLAPFVRYSYYTRYHDQNTSNFDAGLTFTIPLSGEACRRKKTLRAEQDVLSVERETIARRAMDQIRLRYMEIEQMNRSMEGEYRRLQELKDYLKLRQQAYANRIGEYSRLSRIKEYNIYLQSIEKLLEFQYRRNCLITDLQGLLADDTILRYCRTQPLSQAANRPSR